MPKKPGGPWRRKAAAACCFPGDLTDVATCNAAVEKTISTFGALDILVSNAAYQRRKHDIEDISDEEFDKTFRTDMYAYFFLARAALRHMKPGSAIIATSSMTAIRGSKALLDYSSTKGAINAFTKSLALNAVERGIRVNAVAAGPVWTPLNPADAGLSPEQVAEFGSPPRSGVRRSRKNSRPLTCFSPRTRIPRSLRASSCTLPAARSPAEPHRRAGAIRAVPAFLS